MQYPKACAALILLTVGFISQPSLGATVSCPGTADTGDREFTLTTSIAAISCVTGVGNLSGQNNDAINQLGYTTLDKSDAEPEDVLALPGSLVLTPPTSGLSGSFTISAPGFTSLVLALQAGHGQIDPDWAAFLLPAGVLSGSWTISAQELSHGILYGVPSAIPLPAALPLLAGGLGGLGVLSWWRKRKERRQSVLA